MKKTLTMIAVAAAILGFSANVQANQINGSITFGGNATLDADASVATEVLSWHGFGNTGSPFVTGASYDFATFITPGPLTTVAIVAPWSFNSGPISSFWTVGGFTFNLTSSTISSQGVGGVLVTGIGSISGNGFDITEGTWNFSTQPGGIGTTFSFSASSTAVPDGGNTLMLLGSALSVLGFGVFRKSRKA